MQINNTSYIEFKGMYHIPSPNNQTRETLPGIIKKGRQLFYDIEQEGDMIIVTKNKYDSKIKDFIETNNLQFTYYPEISTQSGLDDREPNKLKQLMQILNNCTIKKLSILSKFIPSKELHLSEQSQYIQESLNTLRLNVDGAKIEIDDNGLFIIKDTCHRRTVKTPGFHSSHAYFIIIPDSPNESSQRFLLGKNGKEIIKQFESPTELRSFNKAFINKWKNSHYN